MLPCVTRIALRLAPVVLAGACVACVHKPEMHLDHAEINGVQLATMPPSLGIVMTVVLRVYNPNGYDVAVRAVRGTTLLANAYPLPVTFQAPPDGVWLPAEQTTPVRVPITVPVQLAVALVSQSVSLPTIPYRFTGTADVTATRTFQLEKDNYGVDESGEITRAQLMSVIPAPTLMNPFFPH